MIEGYTITLLFVLSVALASPFFYTAYEHASKSGYRLWLLAGVAAGTLPFTILWIVLWS